MTDPLDVLTLGEGKRAINMKVDNVDNDDVVARHITAVSRVLDDRCGPVVQREVEAEIHGGGGRHVFLRQWPVQSVTLVREASAAGAIVTVEAVEFGAVTEGYQIDGDTGQMTRVGGDYGYAWSYGRQAVEVTYVAGRYEDTETVDPKFKDAAGAILRRLWKREAGSWAQSSDFYETTDDQIGSGFFRVADPIIAELLAGERQRNA